MKEIAKLFTAVKNRDSQALAKIALASSQPKKFAKPEDLASVPAEAKQVVNDIFDALMLIFPMFAAKMEDPEQAAGAKRQWMLAFMDSGVRNQRQIEAGLRKARLSDNHFPPTPGEFIAWCRDGFAEAVGLPSAEQIQTVFNVYCRDKGYVGIEGFKWPAPIYFHIVPRVYDEMRYQNLDAGGVTKLIKSELNRWAATISEGGEIPPIPVMIADKSTAPEGARIKRDPIEFCDLNTEGGRKLHAMFMRVRAKRATQEKK